MTKHFTAVFLIGFIVGGYVLSIPIKKQREYWKGSYCLKAGDDLDFCKPYIEGVK